MSIKGLDRNVSSSQSTLVKREPIQSQNICQNFHLTYQMCFVKMWKISISRFWWCDICKLSHNVRPMLECHYAEEIHATFVFFLSTQEEMFLNNEISPFLVQARYVMVDGHTARTTRRRNLYWFSGVFFPYTLCWLLTVFRFFLLPIYIKKRVACTVLKTVAL